MNLFTIPHTGTRLVRDTVIGGDWTEPKYHKTGNCASHIYTFNAPLLRMKMEQAPTIITLRHPRLTATSWRKYGKDVNELIVIYYILVEMLDEFNPLYLPIDSKDRDKYLDAINKKLGTSYETDWPMVSTYNTRKPDLGEDAEKIERLVKNIQPFLRQFYGNKGRNSAKGG